MNNLEQRYQPKESPLSRIRIWWKESLRKNRDKKNTERFGFREEHPTYKIDNLPIEEVQKRQIKDAISKLRPPQLNIKNGSVVLYKGIANFTRETLGDTIFVGGNAPQSNYYRNQRYGEGKGVKEYPYGISVGLHALAGQTNNSQFSSWTSNREMAQVYGKAGIILEDHFPLISFDVISVYKMIVHEKIDYVGIAKILGVDVSNQRFINMICKNIKAQNHNREFLADVELMTDSITNIHTNN